MKNKPFNFLASRRSVITLAVVLALFIGHYSGFLNSLEQGFFALVQPVERWLFARSAGIGRGVQENSRDFPAELQACKTQGVALASEAAKVNELQDENNKLRAFIDFFSKHEYRKVYADVLAQEFLPEKNEARQDIVIDKGFQDGVSAGLGVINENGAIIGKVVEAKDHSAKICLITSSACKLAATIQNADKTIGVSEGSLGLTIKMNFIPQTEKININDLVVTSGLGELIPRGLLIGRVAAVMNKSNEIWQNATIEPLVDLNGLTIVAVVIP